MGLRDLIARFTVSADAKPLKTVDALMDGLKQKSDILGQGFDNLKGKIGAFSALGAATAFVVNFTRRAEELNQASIRMGVSARQYQALSYATQQYGVDAGQLQGILTGLNTRVIQAQHNNYGLAGSFRYIRSPVKDATGAARPLWDILSDVSDATKRARTETRAFALVERFLGSEATRLLPLLRQGRDGLYNVQLQYQLLGGGLSQRAINAGVALGREWQRTGIIADAFSSTLAMFLLPKLQAVLVRVNQVMIYLNKTSVVVNTLRAAFFTLGAIAAGKLIMLAVASAPLVAQWVLAGAAIGILVLLVDDLITLFSGGKSVIGGFIDEIFGLGTTEEIVADLGARFEEIKYFIKEALGYAREFFGFLFNSNEANPQNRNEGGVTRTTLRRRNGSAIGDPTAGRATLGESEQARRNALDTFQRAGRGERLTTAPRSAVGGRAIVVPGESSPRRAFAVNLPGAPGNRSVEIRNENNINLQIHGATDTPDAARRTRRLLDTALTQQEDRQRRSLEESGLVSFVSGPNER